MTMQDPQEYSARQNVTFTIGIWIATALTYVAQPAVALLWAAVAIVGSVVFLVQERPVQAPVIGAFVLAGFGMLWMLVQLGPLH